MKKTTVPNALIGIAGVHYVASELSRRGLIALPTIRNTAFYDIIVATPDGAKHANIQVKTSLDKVSGWSMPPSDRICSKLNDHYVFLRWIKNEKRFECFMIRGSEVKERVKADEQSKANERRLREGKAPWATIYVVQDCKEPAERWKHRWEDCTADNLFETEANG